MAPTRVHRAIAAAALVAAVWLPGAGALVRAERGAGSLEGVEAPRRYRLAVLPFTPRDAPAGSWSSVRAKLEPALIGRGLELVDPAVVEEHLRAARLRDTSLLTHEDLASLASAVGAERLLLGEIYRCAERPIFAVSLSARLMDPRRPDVLAMTVASVEAAELRGALGGGPAVTIERVIEEAVRRLVADLLPPAEGSPPERSPGMLRPSLLAPRPAAYLSPRLSGRRIVRVTALPFRNQARRLGAGRVAADVLSWCLLASGRAALLDSGAASRRLLQRGWRMGHPVGRAEVLALADEPGADVVLMGSVERWDDGDPASGRPPEVGLTARLLDARTGEILWAASHDRRGDQTLTLYDIGNVRLAEALLAHAGAEMMEPVLEALVKEVSR